MTRRSFSRPLLVGFFVFRRCRVTRDEIVPVSRGGSPIDPGNVQPAHRIRNRRKGNRMPGDETARGLEVRHSREW